LWGICGGFVTLGVDKNAKCWYTDVQDNKVSGHLNDHKYQVSQILNRHKYQVSQILNRHKYQVLFSIKHPIDSH
jgi:hypothetical protein